MYERETESCIHHLNMNEPRNMITIFLIHDLVVFFFRLKNLYEELLNIRGNKCIFKDNLHSILRFNLQHFLNKVDLFIQLSFGEFSNV